MCEGLCMKPSGIVSGFWHDCLASPAKAAFRASGVSIILKNRFIYNETNRLIKSEGRLHVWQGQNTSHTFSLLHQTQRSAATFSQCPLKHPHTYTHTLLSLHQLSFLSKPFSHPLLRLVFSSLSLKMKRREGILWIFNAAHEKCSISHFSTIWTGKLLLQDTTVQVIGWWETMGGWGRRRGGVFWWAQRCNQIQSTLGMIWMPKVVCGWFFSVYPFGSSLFTRKTC